MIPEFNELAKGNPVDNGVALAFKETGIRWNKDTLNALAKKGLSNGAIGKLWDVQPAIVGIARFHETWWEKTYQISTKNAKKK